MRTIVNIATGETSVDEDWVSPALPEPDPINPLTLTLTKRQINAALIKSGITEPDAFIETAIATIADPTERALALNDWRLSPYYERGRPLFNDPNMIAATGMSAQEIDGLWTLGTTLPQ